MLASVTLAIAMVANWQPIDSVIPTSVRFVPAVPDPTKYRLVDVRLVWFALYFEKKPRQDLMLRYSRVDRSGPDVYLFECMRRLGDRPRYAVDVSGLVDLGYVAKVGDKLDLRNYKDIHCLIIQRASSSETPSNLVLHRRR